MSFPFGHSVSCINEDTQQRRFPPFLSSQQAHPCSGRFRLVSVCFWKNGKTEIWNGCRLQEVKWPFAACNVSCNNYRLKWKKRETKALKPSEMGLHSRTRYVIMLKSCERRSREDEIIQFTKGLYDFILIISVQINVLIWNIPKSLPVSSARYSRLQVMKIVKYTLSYWKMQKPNGNQGVKVKVFGELWLLFNDCL